jgi:hypothetical protein
MTAITAESPLPLRRNEAAKRVLAVTRLHFVNKVQILYTPMIVLGLIFLLNLAIWYIIVASNPSTSGSNHLGYSGAVSYIFVYSTVVAIQVILRSFPFSLGFGVTRRDFYLGTALSFVILSVLFSIILTIMSSIEIATNGWGVGGRMFEPNYFTNSFWLARFVMYLAVFLFCLFVGSVGATIYMRWRSTGIVSFLVGIAIILVGIVAIVTLNHRWVALGSWFATTGAFGVTLWTLIPSAVAAICGFLVLRRATPKS